MSENQINYHLFKTQMGVMGVVWERDQILSFKLPAKTKEETRSLLKGTECDVPPTWVDELVQKVHRHLQGENQDYEQYKFNLEEMTIFQQEVLAATFEIPFGEVRSYQEIAQQIGRPKAVRAVGGALGKNPVPLIIPCHRVIGKSGKLTGFSSPQGVSQKTDLLKRESYF